MAGTNFDEVLDLEEQFYSSGYQDGLSDGIKAGRVEGRIFGIEKGFEKYVESGRLHGKSIIWANRTSERHMNTIPRGNQQDNSRIGDPSSQTAKILLALPQLPQNARLTKHLKVLYALAESESLSTENTEEAVSDFDDRFKRAQAKARIIERMAGEVRGGPEDQGKSTGERDGNIEDVKAIGTRH